MNIFGILLVLSDTLDALNVDLNCIICLEFDFLWSENMEKPGVESISPTRCFIKFVFGVAY